MSLIQVFPFLRFFFLLINGLFFSMGTLQIRADAGVIELDLDLDKKYYRLASPCL